MATLLDVIFSEILKVSPSVLAKYSTVQDQVIYLLLIPSVVLFLFLFAFSRQIVGRIVGRHKGFEYLVSVVAFVYILYSGMFGATLIPLFNNWMSIAIVLSMIVFIVSVVFHPARAKMLFGVTKESGKMISGALAKGKETEAIEQEIESINKQIKSIQQNPSTNAMAKSYDEMQIRNLRSRKAELESKL